MSTENIAIFHCLKCGRLVHVDPAAPTPTCCGVLMTLAVPETAPCEDESAPCEGQAVGPESRA